MVSEYRALRASVTRLWTKECGRLEGDDLVDLIRFNEAIDQSLAESTARFSEDLDQSKEMFLAILGHDLRNPISAITMSSQFLRELDAERQPQFDLAGSILRSANRMNSMVRDLLDFTRGSLGSGVPIVRRKTDLQVVAAESIEETKAAHPEAVITFRPNGEVSGDWDKGRLAQLFTNLLPNAVQYGTPDSPIAVAIRQLPGEVEFTVHNDGPPIVAGLLPGLFKPFKRIQGEEAGRRSSDNLGLGLYIAERIVVAHGGTIAVSSNGTGTTFTVHLPNSPALGDAG
jgi:signal transduction histidine kinase